jgi:hypothetical protein
MTKRVWGGAGAALGLVLFVSAAARAASGSCTISVPQSGGNASLPAANRLRLTYDFTYKRKAEESTVVTVTQDDRALILSVTASQKEPITATQTTNGAGVLNDDNITAYIYPQGTTGFAYTFSANPRGARYQTSSENAAYAPEWSVAAKATGAGYALVMRIPFEIMRAGGSKNWRVQISRTIVATNSNPVWCDASAQDVPFDPAFAGTFEGVGAKSVARAARPKPRLAFYGLSETQPGNDTSRIGADIAVPFTPTASFLATLHPDYSNVEVDQQTIAPTAFPRQYQEVRPFFTQLNSYVNPSMFTLILPASCIRPASRRFPKAMPWKVRKGMWVSAHSTR